MIIYEVNLEIEESIYTPFLQWLWPHIEDMKTKDGFGNVLVHTVESSESPVKKLSVHYYVESRQKLQHYFDHHAQSMREDGIKRFGGQFKANRRILTPLIKS